MRFAAGLSAVFAVVLSMEFLLWRPLTAWSRKFRYESSAEGIAEETSIVLDWWRRSAYQAQ